MKRFNIRHPVNLARRHWKSYRIRHQWKQGGVKVSPRAHLFGASGISLNSGTIIYPNAILACSYLCFDDAFEMPTQGSLTLGHNCIVMTGAILATYGGRILVGKDCSFNPGVIVYGHGGVTIGNCVRIAAQTIIVAANHVFENRECPIKDQGLNCKGIIIEDDVWIGAGVRVLDGVKVGRGSVIAAGAVVTRDVDQYSIVAGVPAKRVGTR